MHRIVGSLSSDQSASRSVVLHSVRLILFTYSASFFSSQERDLYGEHILILTQELADTQVRCSNLDKQVMSWFNEFVVAYRLCRKLTVCNGRLYLSEITTHVSRQCVTRVVNSFFALVTNVPKSVPVLSTLFHYVCRSLMLAPVLGRSPWILERYAVVATPKQFMHHDAS